MCLSILLRVQCACRESSAHTLIWLTVILNWYCHVSVALHLVLTDKLFAGILLRLVRTKTVSITAIWFWSLSYDLEEVNIITVFGKIASNVSMLNNLQPINTAVVKHFLSYRLLISCCTYTRTCNTQNNQSHLWPRVLWRSMRHTY